MQEVQFLKIWFIETLLILHFLMVIFIVLFSLYNPIAFWVREEEEYSLVDLHIDNDNTIVPIQPHSTLDT